MHLFYDVYFLTKNYGDYEVSIEKFLKKSNVDYKGIFADTSIFYSMASSGHNNLIIFDYNSFGNEASILSEIIYSLQTCTDCKVVLSCDISPKIKLPFVIEKCNPNIKDRFVKVSNAVIKAIKEVEVNIDNERNKIINKIRNILLELGFNGGELGVDYICESVCYIITECKSNLRIVKDVYSHVAKINNSNIRCVERNIRHAITTGLNNCDHKKIEKNEKLHCFDNLMFNATAKNLIYALVGYIKYNKVFI